MLKQSEGDLSNKIAVVMGTRPGIIKMAPIYKECRARGRGVRTGTLHRFKLLETLDELLYTIVSGVTSKE